VKRPLSKSSRSDAKEIKVRAAPLPEHHDNNPPALVLVIYAGGAERLVS